MKISGHTMGTPEYSLAEAVGLMADIGLDGIEIIVQDDYKCALPRRATATAVREIGALAAGRKLAVSCLTPYASDFNSLDPAKRTAAIDDIKTVFEYAAILHCPAIRIYGGTLIAGDTENYDKKLDTLVETMRALGDEAKRIGTTLVMENHFSTMTVSAAKSASIVKIINHPAVGILYDQANLTFGKEEPWQEALKLQKGLIRHVHVKDLVFKNPDAPFRASMVATVKKEERNIASRVPGAGIVPWTEILAGLARDGYDGWLSLEYERRWHPDDLPDANLGMRQGGAYVRGIVDTLAALTPKK